MTKRRVVITGMGIISPLGNSCEVVEKALLSGKSFIKKVDQYLNIKGIKSGVGALVENIDEKQIPRKIRRSMGPMSIYSTLAAREAVRRAGLSESLGEYNCGVAVGSTTGSSASLFDFCNEISEKQSIETINTQTFLKFMSHTCAANVAIDLGVKGMVWGPSSACSSGSQSIILGAEMIRSGRHDMMVCGGADEHHLTSVSVFNVMRVASSKYNDAPDKTPRPFDIDRDGLVIGEGSGMLILESYEHAKKRGAPILAELEGWASTCDGNHISASDSIGIENCINSSLADANIKANDLDYVNAHATGTIEGDIAEAKAMLNSIKDLVPVSSTKGQTGHSLGASGAHELIYSVMMMQNSCMMPTLNLDNIDPRCDGLNLLQQIEKKSLNRIMSNNFAFGGINTSLIIKQP